MCSFGCAGCLCSPTGTAATSNTGSATILTQTIPDSLTASQDDDSPGYSRLLNENILNEIFSQPGMSDILSCEKQEEKSKEERRATEEATSQGKCLIVCGVMLHLCIHGR